MAQINIVGDYKKSGLKEADIENAVRAIFDFLDKDKDVNVAFVGDNEMKKLNKKYRKKDAPTDVLSFDYEDEGDIILCINQIDKLKESQEKLSEAVLKTLIHGALHLFGFDHEKNKDRDIMEKLEFEVWRKIKQNSHP